MIRKILALLVASLLYFPVSAQNKQQKIVFDFVKADTNDFRIMVSQINNVLKEAPYTTIEVVCSGQGLFMLVSDKTNVSKEMEEIQKVFNVPDQDNDIGHHRGEYRSTRRLDDINFHGVQTGHHRGQRKQ